MTQPAPIRQLPVPWREAIYIHAPYTPNRRTMPAPASAESARPKLNPAPQPQRNCHEPASIGFLTQVRPNRQHIHAGARKAVDGLLRPAHNRFILIEAGIQQRRNSSLPLEAANQFVIKRILLAPHALQSP